MSLATTSQGALDGIRVIDATQMLAGPICATRLGDLGADVIKVESPGEGEFNRTHGLGDRRVDGLMSTFVSVNRNKRSLAIDLKSRDAAQVIRRLVETADVFVQNFRYGTAERLGIGYEQLAAINPRLVYCSISGYGPSGPYRDRPGQDLVIQGYSGSMFSVGAEDDPPTPGALWAGDIMTGYQAAIGILAALQSRSHSGVGQHVQINMLNVVLDAQLQEFVTVLNTGYAPERTREWSAHAAIGAPYGVYRTADGWLSLAMAPLPALGEVLDDDWLRSQTAYNDGQANRDEVYARIRNAFVGDVTSAWLEKCDRHGVWAGPVYSHAQLEQDPHIVSGGFFTTQPDRSGESTVRTVRPPIQLSDTPASIRRGAPGLGQHSREVLSELGFDEATISALADAGVIGMLPS